MRYERHRPAVTLLYPLVERHYPDPLAALVERRCQWQVYAQEEFVAAMKRGFGLGAGALHTRNRGESGPARVIGRANSPGVAPESRAD